VFSGLFFFEFFTPFNLGGRNFLNFNPLLTIASVSDAPRQGVQVVFGKGGKYPIFSARQIGFQA
jgi:hypothetical protein